MNIRDLILTAKGMGWKSLLVGAWLGAAVVGYSIPSEAAGSRFAYVTSYPTSDIFTYEINADGTLTQVGIPLHGTGESPTSISVDETGRFAYVANQASGFVSAYTIGPDGSLAANGTATVGAGTVRPSDALDPLGRFLFVTYCGGGGAGGLSLYKINPDGTLPMGPTQTIPLVDYPFSVMVDRTGRFAYVAHGYAGSASYVSAFIIQPEGALVPNGTVPAGHGDVSVAAHPIGPFVYVSSSNSSTVSAYRINPDGTLSPGPTETTGEAYSPKWVTVEPTGRFLYAMTDNGAYAVFLIDNIDGTLTLSRTVRFSRDRFYSFAIDPTGRFVYAVSYDANVVFIFSINLTTGDLEPIDRSPFPLEAGNSYAMATGAAAAPRFAYVANSRSDDVSAYSIGSDGALTEIPGSPFPTHWDHFQIAVDPQGRNFAYVVNANSNTVASYRIATDGQLSRISVAPTGNFPVWVTTDRLGRFAYVANLESNTVSSYRIEEGMLREIGASPSVGRAPVSVAVEPNGTFAYVLNNEDASGGVRSTVSAYLIDQDTGALLPLGLGTVTAGMDGLALTVDRDGRHVFVANGGYLRGPDPEPGNISVYAIQDDGRLVPIPGSPFQLDAGNRGYANSLTMDNFSTLLYATGQSSEGRWGVFGFWVYYDGTLEPLRGSPFETIEFPESIAVDSNNFYAYVVNSRVGRTNLVSAYTIDEDFSLVPLVTAETGADPVSVAADPRVSRIYVVNHGSNSISVFDSARGILTPVPGSPFRDGYVSSVTTSHGVRSRFAYMTNVDMNVLSPNVINGARRPVDDPASGSLDIERFPALTGRAPISAAVDPTNRYVYVANYGFSPEPGDISCYKINLDGSLARNGAIAAGRGPNSVTVDPTGRYVYVANQESEDIYAYRINVDGTLEPNGRQPAGFLPIAVIVDRTGQYVYAPNSGSNDISAYAVNPDGSLGDPVSGSPFAVTASPTSGTVCGNAMGQFVYVAMHDVSQPTVAALQIDGAGGLVPIGNQPIGRGPGSVNADPTCQFMYVANYASSNISAYRINPDGTLADVIPGQPFPTRDFPTSIVTTW